MICNISMCYQRISVIKQFYFFLSLFSLALKIKT